MTEIVRAVYENGMLRPLQALKLRECQTVRIYVLAEEPTQPEPANEVDQVIQSLVAAGLMGTRPKRDDIPPDPLPGEERRALADRLGSAPGKPASEMVIEDRGER